MIELIRSWITGITIAAVLVALAESLSPPGAVKKAGRLVGGLVLLLAVLKPVMGLDSHALAAVLSEYQLDMPQMETSVGIENAYLMKAIIEERTGAYILDKASALGIDCRVTVTATAGEDGGYPVPDRVDIAGALTETQRGTLTRTIEADLAIPAERQTYRCDTEDVK